MYGVIFDFLRQYVIERHGGTETWNTLLRANGYNFKIYFPVTEYPDEEIVKLAVTASEALDVPLPTVLEDFGSFVGHKLVTFYHMYVDDPNWKTFDIILNAGEKIHHAVNRHNRKRKPPKIIAEQLNDDQILIHYQSDRKLCAVVRGIVRGLGEHYKEYFRIEETACMHEGAHECLIKVTRAA